MDRANPGFDPDQGRVAASEGITVAYDGRQAHARLRPLRMAVHSYSDWRSPRQENSRQIETNRHETPLA
jgi:hypothetical protein